MGAVVVGALIAYLSVRFPDTLDNEDNQLRLVIGVLWLALVGSAVASRATTGGVGLLLRNLVIWGAIGLGLLTAYSFRAEFAFLKDRVTAELVPHRGSAPPAAAMRAGEPPSITFRTRQGGHFVVEAQVNGSPIRFMVDTGASDVMLTAADARRAGINPNALNFTQRYQTANGIALGAPVVLTRVSVGPVEVENVHGSVSQAEGGISLLGMSFLGRLSGYEVRDGALTLRQ
ncbi:MAG: TIGR02281 family clan AA aspartic protease [Alphaproteobacteria bacterium]|nr:TIGR02281 family clan AA aspartic protease [Alphaproteobacteria bacterium]